MARASLWMELSLQDVGVAGEDRFNLGASNWKLPNQHGFMGRHETSIFGN